MKTKALLLTAALGVAGIATSMAQVYSVNAVGYINVTIPATTDISKPVFKLISNQLRQQAPADATIASLIPTPPDFTQVFVLRADGGFDIGTYLGGWDNGNILIANGSAAFISSSDLNPFTITFVGEVLTGTLNNPIPTGLSMKSSMVPQQGGIQTVLGYDPRDFDQIYQFDPATQNFIISTFLTDWGCPTCEPVIGVGEGTYIFADPSSAPHPAWSRTFTF